MEKDKFLFVVSGAAGTGKDSVVKALREAHPEIEKTVSATTRSPRPGEQEGVDYYYRTQEQFRQLIDTDQVVEYNFYNGNYYGTLREEVDKRLEAGNWWFWSSTCTALPTSAGCSRVLPRCSCCRRRWKNWNTACVAAEPRPKKASASVWPRPRASWPSRISSPSSWSTTR